MSTEVPTLVSIPLERLRALERQTFQADRRLEMFSQSYAQYQILNLHKR